MPLKPRRYSIPAMTPASEKVCRCCGYAVVLRNGYWQHSEGPEAGSVFCDDTATYVATP